MNQSPSAPPTKKSPEKDGYRPVSHAQVPVLDLALVDDAQASDVFEHEWWNRVVHLVDVPRCRQAFAQRAAYCPPAGTVEGLAPGENDAGIVLVDVVAVPGESLGFEEGVAKHV